MKDKLWFTPVRFSHLTSHAAVGSVVRDQNDWLMFVKDISNWPEKDMLQLHAVERIKRNLSVSCRLLLPPEAGIEDKTNLKINGGTIPTERFPSWAMCQTCNLLHFKPWLKQDLNINDNIRCSICSAGVLHQVTWCATSSLAGLMDVPWHKICHRKSVTPCTPERNTSYLKLEQNDRGVWKVTCTKCPATGRFEHADFDEYFHYQPGVKVGSHTGGNPIIYTIMEVNDPRVYSAANERALVIPPESNIDRKSLVYRLQQHSHVVSDIKNATRALQRRREIKKALRAFRCNEDDLFEALDSIDREKELTETLLDTFDSSDMLGDEYEALIARDHFSSEADFITRHFTDEWRKYVESELSTNDLRFMASLVDRLVAVERLRVIEVFKGFQRSASDADKMDSKIIQSPDFSGTLDWLPAIELFGEGIFFTLDCEKLEQWESNRNIRRRAQEIEERYNDSEIDLPEEALPTPRFIMLHTLAHLFMRELESSAGYPAASLQERIYCSTNGSMAGIMIYTAVPDVAGSLGGIIELAKPAKFSRILDATMREAEWCSMDPVCSEMEGQGPSWLNRAACHGCALVPDTSCSYHNVFLDRVFIKGNMDEGIPSLADIMR